MKKVFAVILAAVLVTLMSAGCFAEAGPEMPDGLFRHIVEMWTDEGEHWYQAYFAGLGPHSMSFPGPDLPKNGGRDRGPVRLGRNDARDADPAVRRDVPDVEGL